MAASTGVITTGGAVAVGSATTASQSQLAAQFTPGAEPSATGGVIFGAILLIAGAILFGESAGLAIIFIILGAIIMFGMYYGKKAGRREWRAKVKMYEQGWICMQCGKSWLQS